MAIPTRSRPHFLVACLNSIVGQTRHPIDVLVSEDGRDPATAAVVERFAALLPIRHIVNDKPVGEQGNRRQAFRESGGDLVGMLDDDDMWEPRFLEATSDMLVAHPDCGFCSTDHWWMDERGGTLIEATEAATRDFGRSAMRTGVYEDVLLRLLTSRPFAFQATLFRRSALAAIGFVPIGDETAALDYSIFLELGAARVPAAYIAERLGRYRVHAGQATHKRVLMASSKLSTFERIARYDDLPEHERIALARLYRRQVVEAAIAQAHAGDRRAALATLRRFTKQGVGLPSPSRMLALTALLFGLRKVDP